MRAYRPSRFGRQDDVDEEVEAAKQDNLQRYEQRAQDGLPLFEKVARSADPKRAASFFATKNR